MFINNEEYINNSNNQSKYRKYARQQIIVTPFIVIQFVLLLNVLLRLHQLLIPYTLITCTTLTYQIWLIQGFDVYRLLPLHKRMFTHVPGQGPLSWLRSLPEAEAVLFFGGMLILGFL